MYLSLSTYLSLELYLTIYFAPFISLCLSFCVSSLHFLCACTTKGITGDLLDRAREYLDKLRARDRDDENGDDSYNPSIGVNIPQRDKHQVNYKSMVHESGHIRVENGLPSNDDYSDGDDDMDDDPDESQRVSIRNDYLSIILFLCLSLSLSPFLSLVLSLYTSILLTISCVGFLIISVNSLFSASYSTFTSCLLHLIWRYYLFSQICLFTTQSAPSSPKSRRRRTLFRDEDASVEYDFKCLFSSYCSKVLISSNFSCLPWLVVLISDDKNTTLILTYFWTPFFGTFFRSTLFHLIFHMHLPCSNFSPPHFASPQGENGAPGYINAMQFSSIWRMITGEKGNLFKEMQMYKRYILFFHFSVSSFDFVRLLIIFFFSNIATSSFLYAYQWSPFRFDASNRGALSLEDFLDGWAKISMESGGSTILKRVRALAAEGFSRDNRESRKH